MDFPLNHNKQKCKMFPNNSHGLVMKATRLQTRRPRRKTRQEEMDSRVACIRLWSKWKNWRNCLPCQNLSTPKWEFRRAPGRCKAKVLEGSAVSALHLTSRTSPVDGPETVRTSYLSCKNGLIHNPPPPSPPLPRTPPSPRSRTRSLAMSLSSLGFLMRPLTSAPRVTSS